MKTLSSAILLLFCSVAALIARPLPEIFEERGFDLDQIQLPEPDAEFPLERFENPEIETLATFEGFPEGPSYRPSDGSHFFSGNVSLRQVTPEGELRTILDESGGGGTHLLPDGSFLLIGRIGLRQVFPDGRVALIADGEEIGGGNDITMGIHGEVYFTVPKEGIYRVTPGKDGKVEMVSKHGGNGLDVDPKGEYLYVHQGGICRYRIHGMDQPLGEREQVYKAPKGMGGGDGCTFDAWGNFYSVVFRRGVMTVLDPEKRKIIAEVDLPVKPATNLTFTGPANNQLFITAGVPRLDNCAVLKMDLGITGFPGHMGASEYPILRFLDSKAQAF